jgi:protein transport protein SEC61 subunit gamma-like protein
MDLNQGQSGERKPDEETSGNSQDNQAQAPAEKPKFSMKIPQLGLSGQKFYMPKLKMPNLREKLTEYGRVLKVTKRPDSIEFKTIVKASGLGITIIGVIGFIVAIVAQILTT